MGKYKDHVHCPPFPERISVGLKECARLGSLPSGQSCWTHKSASSERLEVFSVCDLCSVLGITQSVKNCLSNCFTHMDPVKQAPWPSELGAQRVSPGLQPHKLGYQMPKIGYQTSVKAPHWRYCGDTGGTGELGRGRMQRGHPPRKKGRKKIVSASFSEAEEEHKDGTYQCLHFQAESKYASPLVNT